MRILYVALLLFAISTTVNSAPSSENNKAAIEALEQCIILLQDEEIRWQTIHTNPVTDVVTVAKDGDNLIVNVTLDTCVKNIINDMPIQRQYTLIPSSYNYWAPFDLMISGSYMSSVGWRPTFGCGWSPKVMRGLGATINTSLMGVNAGVYYRVPQVPCVFVQGLVGITLTGQMTLGVGLGIRI